MTRSKIIVTAAAAALLSAGLGGAASAKPGLSHGHLHHGPVLGGVILGGIVFEGIAAASVEEECFRETRRTYDDEGNVYVRRVQVCQ